MLIVNTGNAPSPYLPSTPGGPPPMTPSSAYLPGTPGGQPMTPGSGGLDMMSPAVGGDNDGPLFLPDILVNVHRAGEDASLGVIREVLLVFTLVLHLLFYYFSFCFFFLLFSIMCWLLGWWLSGGSWYEREW